MDKSENGLSNLLANRMPSLNSFSSNLQQLRTNVESNSANGNFNNAAFMNAFNLAGLGLWDNQSLISAMSQCMDAGTLLNLKQKSSADNSRHSLKRSEDDDNLENRCNRDVLDLKMNNIKRFKSSNDCYVQTNNHKETALNLNSKSASKDLSFLDNNRNFPCPECGKTFAAEVDLKFHMMRHVMQHPFSCSTCGKGFKYEHTLAFHEKQHGLEPNNKLNLKNSNKKQPNNSNPTHQASDQLPKRTDHHLLEESLLGSRKQAKFPSTSSVVSNLSKQQLQHYLDDEEDNKISNSLLIASSLSSKLNNSSSLTATNSKSTPNSSLFSSSNSSSTFEFGFPNSKMSNLGIQMKSEKVLIVMVEGVNPLNDQTYTLYKCNICGFAFPNLPPVAEHVLTAHSNGQKFNCDKCGANFKWRNELLLHDQIHKAMDAQQVGGKLMMPQLMQNNLMLVNQYLNASGNDQNKLDSNNNDNLLLNSNKTNGNHANGQLDSLMGLNLIKTTQRKDSESSQESLNLNVKTKNGRAKDLRNEELDELSKNIAVVKENVTNELGEIEETAPGQFKCRYCDKTFDRVFSVHRHERVHTGFKPCICKVCGKGFSEKRNLRHHLIRFHSDGSGRELLRRVRKDKTMNMAENNEARRQLKMMEMNILSINNNSFQSNTGSDEELPATLNSFYNNSSSPKDKQTNGDHEDNSSNHSAENSTASNRASVSSSSRRRKSVKPYKVNQSMKPCEVLIEQQDTEDEKDEIISSSDQTSVKEVIEDEDSNNGSANED